MSEQNVTVETATQEQPQDNNAKMAKVRMAKAARNVLRMKEVTPVVAQTEPKAPEQPAPTTVTPQQPGESDAKYEIRMAETLRKLAKAEGSSALAKQRADELEREWAPIKTLIAEARGNPDKVHDLLELAGYSPADVAQLMIDKKLKPRAQTAKLPPEVQARIDELEKSHKRLKEREEAEEAARAAESDMSVIRQELAARKTDHPLLAALPDAHSKVYAALKRAHDNGQPVDLEGELKRAEASLERDLRALLNPDILSKLLTDSSVRDMFRKAIGIAQPAQASDDRAKRDASVGPKSLTVSATSEIPTRNGTISEAERRQRLKNAARGVLGLK